MKKLFILALMFTTLGICNLSLAQESKVITLKDGSTLKGNVLELKRGKYTIKTKNLGIIEVNQDDITSISSKLMANTQPVTTTTSSIQTGQTLSKANLDSQVQRVQNKIVSNPALMADIQDLMNDPEVMSALSDPAFMQRLMTLDMQTIENDPKLKVLMSNPKMMSLINKLK